MFSGEGGRLGEIRIGVLGGTFNPVHAGHLHLARAARRAFSLSRVHFVVACAPPHKRPGDLIPLMHRYAMVSLALAGEKEFVPSLVELGPKASGFAIDALGKLARQAGRTGERLYFIAGGDSLAEVHSWRESRKLLESYDFIFVTRPGTGTLELPRLLPPGVLRKVRDWRGLGPVSLRRRIGAEPGGESRIYIVDAKAPDISSSRIRELVRRGKTPGRMVPAGVREYIRKLELYGE